MTIEPIIKILLTALCSLLLCGVVNTVKKEYTPLVATACVLVITTYTLTLCTDRFSSFLSSVTSMADAASAVEVVLKGAVISVSSRLVKDLCKDNSNHAVAGAVDICARLMIVALSIPLIESVLKTALAFLE